MLFSVTEARMTDIRASFASAPANATKTDIHFWKIATLWRREANLWQRKANLLA
jgi:hypothetical protein